MLNKNELTSIALKLAAIYILVELLVGSIIFGASVSAGILRSTDGKINVMQSGTMFFVGVVAVLIPIIVSWFLWRTSNRIIVSEDSKSGEQLKISDLNIYLVPILVGAGLIISVNSLKEILGTSSLLLSVQWEDINRSVIFTGTHPVISLIGSILKFLVGASLVIGREGWANIINRIRFARSA